MIGSLLIGEIEQKTNIRLRIVDDFEICTIAIDVDYDSEVVIFTGWLYRINTPHSVKVNKSESGEVTVFKQDIVEYSKNKCYIPTSGNCFIKSTTFITGEKHAE